MFLSLGYSKEAGHEQELTIGLHVRVKGCKRDRQKEITIQDFENMIDGDMIVIPDIERFATKIRHINAPAVKTVKAPKFSMNIHGKEECGIMK